VLFTVLPKLTTTLGSYKVIKKIIQKVKAHRCTGALQSKVCMDDEIPSWWLQQLRIN